MELGNWLEGVRCWTLDMWPGRDEQSFSTISHSLFDLAVWMDSREEFSFFLSQLFFTLATSPTDIRILLLLCMFFLS